MQFFNKILSFCGELHPTAQVAIAGPEGYAAPTLVTSQNISVRQHTFRKIADQLRAEIISGKYQPGDRFPSTAKLAACYKASVSTVHAALVGLVKEGWLERINGAGTFVSHRRLLFTCAGIYQGLDISSNEHPAFSRTLHASLLKTFREHGKKTEVFIDTRPPEQQAQLLPTLDQAIQQRRIQGLVAPSISDSGTPSFLRLQLPTAFLNQDTPHHVHPDHDDLLRQSMQYFIAQNCHSVGIITTLARMDPRETPDIFQRFREAARKAALLTRDEWICTPSQHVIETGAEEYGYTEFMRFWELREKPEGLLIYPDATVRGIITAILDLGWRTVIPRLKLILHSNAHNHFLCPFPAMWAVTNEDTWAQELIRMLEEQFEGKIVSPALIPFEFRANVPPTR